MARKTEQLHRIVAEYRLAGNPWPAESREIARWAMNTRRWKPSPYAAERQCAREISRAMREEYYTDGQGRRVRLKHPVKAEQGVLWMTSGLLRERTWRCHFSSAASGFLTTADS